MRRRTRETEASNEEVRTESNIVNNNENQQNTQNTQNETKKIKEDCEKMINYFEHIYMLVFLYLYLVQKKLSKK